MAKVTIGKIVVHPDKAKEQKIKVKLKVKIKSKGKSEPDGPIKLEEK